MSDKENKGYRGYCNYETWKMMVDYFNHLDLDEIDMIIGELDSSKTHDQIVFSVSIPVEDYVLEMLEDKAPSYILESFTNNIDFYEIAESLLTGRDELIQQVVAGKSSNEA